MNVISECLREVKQYMASRSGMRDEQACRWVIARTKTMLGDVLEMNATNRNDLIKNCDTLLLGYLQGIARSMAEFALNLNAPECLQVGVTSLMVEDVTLDSRETLIESTLLLHSAIQLGVSLKDSFTPIQHHASESFIDLFEGFIESGGSTIDQMRFQLLPDRYGGFRYQSYA